MDAILNRQQPTAFQLFIEDPLLFLAERIYHWRSRACKACSSENPVSVVCISDTHSHHDEVPPLPPADLLIHAGDLSQSGSYAEVHAALQWLSQQSHTHKIVIAGNHDRALSEPDGRTSLLGDFPDLVYLDQSSVNLTINGRKLHIYGSPLSPKHGSWAFQYRRQDADWSNIVPQVDILITHGPPAHHLDLQGAGCRALLEALWQVRPRLHVFGHIHAARGVEHLDWSGAQAAYERICSGTGSWLDLLRVMLGKLSSSGSTTLVNAASLGGCRDEQRRGGIVIDI